MNKLTKILCCILLSTGAISHQAQAQCAAGEIEISVNVETDAYGYEGYWQLIPSGNDCGDGVIFEGGNISQVGCSGAGDQDATTAFGYADNITTTEGAWCVTEDASYDIIYVDDWGDGGFKFTVLIGEDELPIHEFTGSGEGNTFTFSASLPLDWDIEMTTLTTYAYQFIEPINIEGNIFNQSANIINSVDMYYTIDGGSPVMGTVSGLSVAPFTSAVITHPVAWTPSITGNYNIQAWCSNLNGNTDMNTSNDTAALNMTVGDAVPNLIDIYLELTPVFTIIGSSDDDIDKPKDLDFHPTLSNYELWVINAGVESSGGETVTFFDAGLPGQTVIHKQDGNAWHFMSLPSGIAFSRNTNFATSPAVKDANHGGGHFTGPALWSSDMDIYAEPSGGNGSHLDMIHQSPYAMGIEYDKNNAFWIYNGFDNSIDWVDFVEDHGPGNDYHGDGKVRRYSELGIEYEDLLIPCHLVLDRATGWLYIVDNGNGRVLRMNVNSGDEGSSFTPYSEPLAESIYIENVEWEEYLTTGFVMPSGIELFENRMLVGDYETGEIIIYDISGTSPTELGRINTGAAGLTGIKIGPDGKIWFVNALTDELMRIDLGAPLSVTNNDTKIDFAVYPNPASDFLTVSINHATLPDAEFLIYNTLGELLYTADINQNITTADVSSLPSGTYQLIIRSSSGVATEQVVLQK